MTDNPNMPIGSAVVSWQDSGGLHIRVYSTDGYTVIERCTDTGGTGWTAGSLNVPGSDVSATVWQDSGGVHLRVYATFEDGTTEWCYDPGSTAWAQGSYTV